MIRLPFILASASPRRRFLIRTFPFRARVVPGRTPERRPMASEPPARYALAMAEQKANEVARRVGRGLVLGADTIVHLGGTIFGKPTSKAAARRMLAALAGRWHEVHTGLCLVAVPGRRAWRATARTRVRLKDFSKPELDRLARRNHDKAGAYAAQARGNPFVAEYRGDYDNVVGLPRKTLQILLKKAAKAGFRPKV
jgi:septum formation protein